MIMDTKAVATRDQRASTVAKVLVEEWFYRYGVPTRIHSDQGRNFESALIQQLCAMYGFAKHAPPHTIHKEMVTFSYNTTIHQSTGESPYLLMFGQEPQLPIDFLLGRVGEPTEGRVDHWVQEHQRRLQTAFDGARVRLKVAAERRKERQDQLPLPKMDPVPVRGHCEELPVPTQADTPISTIYQRRQGVG
ncbi:hypothetical protein AAFF_G00397170 [Aldrovandia affinis]|uniref:Integrase catalytic domain-containing protein n=1 Tax=Aldrovandia affinis TaxID=143900 RepID=A0AAD7WLD2_9TELE|nr:hypothetical protein AAFF_G00397170 [Aldrovandia affinis]